MEKILEKILVSAGNVTADLGGETADTITTGTFIKLDKYRKCLALGASTGNTSAGVLTLTLYQATATDGTGSKTIGTDYAVTGTATATDQLINLEVEVDVDALDTASSFYFVGAKLAADTTAGTDNPSAIILARDVGRFNPQSN